VSFYRDPVKTATRAALEKFLLAITPTPQLTQALCDAIAKQIAHSTGERVTVIVGDAAPITRSPGEQLRARYK
jgi:hypothetical protein